jgi:hypothetical protein
VAIRAGVPDGTQDFLHLRHGGVQREAWEWIVPGDVNGMVGAWDRRGSEPTRGIRRAASMFRHSGACASSFLSERQRDNWTDREKIMLAVPRLDRVLRSS